MILRRVALLLSVWLLVQAHADDSADWQRRREASLREIKAAHPDRASTPVVIQDDWFAPRMVVVPVGEFTMGSNCGTLVLRGVAWASARLRTATSRSYPASWVVSRHGFRVTRVL